LHIDTLPYWVIIFIFRMHIKNLIFHFIVIAKKKRNFNKKKKNLRIMREEIQYNELSRLNFRRRKIKFGRRFDFYLRKLLKAFRYHRHY
jgi:hypothetical protein